MKSTFKNMGIGVGLRSTHYSKFSQEKPKSVAWVEVISENYMRWRDRGFGQSLETLQGIRENYPVALHGVSMNLGSVDDVDLDYLERLKELITLIDPFIISDHLSWTGMNGENLHDLLPLPYTEEALSLFTNKLDKVQTFLGKTILIENPSSYLEYRNSEMTEVEFVQQLLRRSGCGLLLDINNVYVSSVNHGFDPIEYLKAIPGECIGQIHLAGHSQINGYLIDTHDAPVCEDVWMLYRWAVRHFGTKSTMIERDDHIPVWEILEKELNRIGEINEDIEKSR